MPGPVQKRARSPSPVSFGKLHCEARPFQGGLGSMGDPLSNSGSFQSNGFICDMAPLQPTPRPTPTLAPSLYRFSPRMNPGLFNSPMFSVRTPVLEYSSAPSVFNSTSSAPFMPPPRQSLIMSPMPFMDSPATPMRSTELQQSLDAGPGLDSVPLSLNEPQPSSSVLERFKKFFDEQRTNDASPLLSGAFARHHHQPFQQQAHSAGIMPADDDDDNDNSSVDASIDSHPHMLESEMTDMTKDEYAEQLLRSGSSCHQCKSRRMQGALSFCAGGGKSKRKACRKKYCDQCLTKFYQMESSRHANHRDGPKWCCPSCQGICCCAACRRSKDRKPDSSLRASKGFNGNNGPELHSPATSIAVGMVYFGDFDLVSGASSGNM